MTTARAVLASVIVLGLGACDDPDRTEATHKRMYEAVSSVVCASNREDVELALGDVATESFYQDQNTIDDYVTQMAGDVTCPSPIEQPESD